VKRFPEQFDASNPDEVYLAGLLKHARPVDPSAEQMQRVWTTLERSGSRRPRRRVSGPIVAGLVLFGATVASATMPRVWKSFRATTSETTSAPLTTATIAAKAVPRRVPPVAPPAPTPVMEPTAEMAPLPEAPLPPPAGVVRKSTSPRPRITVTESVDSLTSGVPLVEAIRERRAGHIARARELATEYRLKNPGGALYEEALALCVETSAALGDEEATQLARLYLERYPRGRFRAQAQRVVDKAR
jgi:hypothetical protein